MVTGEMDWVQLLVMREGQHVYEPAYPQPAAGSADVLVKGLLPSTRSENIPNEHSIEHSIECSIEYSIKN